MLPVIYIILDELSSLFLQDAAPVVRIFLFLIFITIYVISQKTLEKIYLLKKNINDILEILEVINDQTSLLNSNNHIFIKEYNKNIEEFNNLYEKINYRNYFFFSEKLLKLIKNNKFELTDIGKAKYNKLTEIQKLW
jgi:hypothetical protein